MRDNDVAERARAQPGELNYELVCQVLHKYPNGECPLFGMCGHLMSCASHVLSFLKAAGLAQTMRLG
jgi:hypothetical protein